MRLPDITKMINDVQRNKIPKEDIPIVCNAVINYHKMMNEVCATKRDMALEYDAVEHPTNKVLFKYLDKVNKTDLLELAIILNVAVTEDDTREQIITKIKGE